MSFRIEGIKPDDALGEYFGATSWDWRPIWEYCRTVAPEICNKVKGAHYTDGDGLNAEDASKLSSILFTKLEMGLVKNFEENYAGFTPTIFGLQYEIPKNSYPFWELNIAQFAAFLKHCGGFKIC